MPFWKFLLLQQLHFAPETENGTGGETETPPQEKTADKAPEPKPEPELNLEDLKAKANEYEKLRKKIEDYEAKEAERKKAELTEVERLKLEAEEAKQEQAKLTTKLNEERKRIALANAAVASGARNVDAVLKLVDASKLSIDDTGNVQGVQAEMERLKKNFADLSLFGTPKVDTSAPDSGKGNTSDRNSEPEGEQSDADVGAALMRSFLDKSKTKRRF